MASPLRAPSTRLLRIRADGSPIVFARRPQLVLDELGQQTAVLGPAQPTTIHDHQRRPGLIRLPLRQEEAEKTFVRLRVVLTTKRSA